MSEFPAAPDENNAEDDERTHSQDPAEGADPDSSENREIPRVHGEDPAEG